MPTLTDADETPITTLGPMDQLLLEMSLLRKSFIEIQRGMENLDAIRHSVQATQTTQLQMYEHQQREGGRMRLAIGACVSCALICIVCVFLTYAQVARAADQLERLEQRQPLLRP